MAEINKLGNVVARCPGCDGGKSTFEYSAEGRQLGSTAVVTRKPYSQYEDCDVQFRLFRCAGCGRGGLGAIRMMKTHSTYPADIWQLLWFYPEAKARLPLPKETPKGIVMEFREAEICKENECFRASAAMFRSVIDKVLRQNGYKIRQLKNLKEQIDAAAADGVITEARKRKAHEDVRVLGNDVLHDEWREVKEEDVDLAHHYTQRVLEDFYDDRESVLKLIREAGRKPIEDVSSEDEQDET
ncbi:MAG: DUF4145 domain-containing protein [Desulfuromonadaceae bacterium]|nr:DUF4145 domain-containing protein [Desulfuromonadaceae bacterium]